MNWDWLASLFVLPCLGITALYMRKQLGDWWAPAVCFPALWFIVIGLPLVLAPEYNIWAPGVWVLCLLVLLFSVGALLGQSLVKRPPEMQINEIKETGTLIIPVRMNYRLGRLKFAIFINALLGLFAIQVLLWEASKSWSDLTQVITWIEMGAKFSIARYNEGYVEPIGARIGLFGLYWGSLLGGLLGAVGGKTKGKWIISLLPILLTILYSAIMTTRAGIMFSLSMWIASFLAAKVGLGYRGHAMFSAKSLLIYLSIGGGLFLLTLVLQLSRGGADNLSQVGETAAHTKVWFCGHVSGFSNWLENDLFRAKELGFGQKTFGGPFQVLGLGSRDQGIYTDFIMLTGTEKTNIYTAFRGFIEDFGLPGSLLIVGWLGFLSGRVYAQARRGRLMTIPFLAIIYANLIWTPIVSMLNYNTLFLSFALLFIVFPWLVSQPEHIVELEKQ